MASIDGEDNEPIETPLNTWKFLIECDITGFTLIMPSVAVGNVAQLTCDLVISSLKMKKMGTVYSPALIHIMGYDPYQLGSPQLTGCCELYVSEEKKMLVLLLRAPLVYKYAEQFLIEVVDKFKADNIKDFILLTSSFAHEKKHIMTSPFRYAANELCPYISRIQALEWLEHEPKIEFVKVRGGGFSSLLYKIIKERSMPCLLIYKFASEGDNIPDAVEMLTYVNGATELFADPDFYKNLDKPASWNLMYGGPAPGNIY